MQSCWHTAGLAGCEESSRAGARVGYRGTASEYRTSVDGAADSSPSNSLRYGELVKGRSGTHYCGAMRYGKRILVWAESGADRMPRSNT